MMLSAILRRPTRLIQQLAGPLPPLLAALFEDSGIGALVLDGERRIVRTNRRMDSIVAVVGAVQGAQRISPDMPAETLFVAADRRRVASALVAALRGDPSPPLEVRLATHDSADATVVALSITPLHERDGTISGLLLGLTDVSAEKRLEAELVQLQKLRAVGQLAGGIAHDFNNLLMAIGAAADAVLERETCERSTIDDVRQIRQSADRGAALVRQLLAFGRRQPLQPAVLDVNAAIRNLADMLARLLGEHIRLHLDLEEPGRSVSVDPTQFDQVLVNLAVNSRDAMPRGGTLTLRTGHLTLYEPRRVGAETLPPGRYVAISVEDAGEGIAPTSLPQVFEPFFTTRRQHGGSGLGLSTVYGIVRQSGGFVTIESTVGQGTSVRFWLPRHEATEVVSTACPTEVVSTVCPIACPTEVISAACPTDASPGAMPETGAHAAAGSVSVLHPAAPAMPDTAAIPKARRFLLLVEDEESVRRLTERALRRAGWEVTAVDSAEAALERLPRPGDVGGPPSVLVSDIILPGMDGTQLVRAVRAVWPKLPTVLVSGYTDSALVGDLTAQGVSFLAKPFQLRELVACVERAVG